MEEKNKRNILIICAVLLIISVVVVIIVLTVNSCSTAEDDFEKGLIAEGYSVRIGRTGYETLDGAIDSVKDGETISFLQNLSATGWVTINKPDTSFTVDFRGKEIERADGSLFDIYSKVVFKDSLGTGKAKAKGRVFYCNAGADCILESGNIENIEGSCINVYGDYASPTESIPVFTMNGGNVVCEEGFYVDAQKYGAKLIVNGGTLTANGLAISGFNSKTNGVEITINGGKLIASGDYGITVNGNYGGATVTINGGEITNEVACAVYMPGQNTYSIKGGKFKGREALVVKGGSWNIMGGEFIAIGEEKNPVSPDNSGYSPTGDCLYVEDNYGEKTSLHNVYMNIANAKFTSLNGYAVSGRFFNSSENKIPAVINIGNNVRLISASGKKKVRLSNGFLGSVNGINAVDIEIF